MLPPRKRYIPFSLTSNLCSCPPKIDIKGLNITVAAENVESTSFSAKAKAKAKTRGDGLEILASAELRLRPETHYALVGPNGSGKSSNCHASPLLSGLHAALCCGGLQHRLLTQTHNLISHSPSYSREAHSRHSVEYTRLNPAADGVHRREQSHRDESCGEQLSS